jgi:hypothetical protein
MPKFKKGASLNKNLTVLFCVICIITTLLLTSHNLNQYLRSFRKDNNPETNVLGTSKDDTFLLEEKSFWFEFLNLHPAYFPGWIELAKIEKNLGNSDGFNLAVEKAKGINPNSQEIVDLLQ